MRDSHRFNDAVLASLLGGADGEARDRAIQELVMTQALPAISTIVRDQLRSEPDAAAEIQQDVLVRLIARLRRLAADPVASSIADFSEYVGRATRNAIEDHRRRNNTKYWQLLNRTRYLLTHDDEFSLWMDEEWVCGYARDAGRRAQTTPDTVTVWPGDLRRFVTQIFDAAGGPVALSAIVERAVESNPPLRTAARSHEEGHDVRFEALDRLRQLWREILLLPARQRRALLLQVRDDSGESLLRLLPATGIATTSSILDALEMTEGEIERIWHDLPLDDQRIAAMLGVPRQQVINLRKSARARLLRRMRRM